MLLVLAWPATADAKACSVKVLSALREPATKQDSSLELRCDLALKPDDVITKRLLVSGEKASGITLDCNGAMLDGSRGTVNFGKPSLLIRSMRDKKGGWSVPGNVTIRNCVIKGAIRLQGLGTNGQAKAVKQSSLSEGHTARAQAAAPSGIALSGLSFIADGRIPLYLGPGTTGLTLSGSKFTGKSDGTAIYLDAESAGNTISGNTFAATTRSREQIAIDGSARNVISGNTFENPVNGGIFLYRNCGEGGTIRHQTPQENTISGNRFVYQVSSTAKPAVWLNSRNGWSWHCFHDPAYPFGSSLSPLDFAQHNTVTDNRIEGGDVSLIRNSDKTNRVEGNGS
ncbi:hypothetical protein AX760_08095 [Pararhizobium antarcticum]|uniref:Periplasmic copper-binding protein NosD beta helix domain-containing protein n=2 Tax=Pararhizobium antarcticum TaxID=1798805 RepID=A0A657LMS9_9HYPH|nr:hypothetical protein AX760_08095 [Pararhizobium antarcticum]OJF98704.1 hypothetical protein AX761_02680 [Rhizobium sp. 58]